MPIDARIALGVQPMQIDSSMRVVGQGLQLQNMLRQGDMQAMQMQDMQAGRERQNALRALLAQDGDMATLPDRLIKGGFVDEGLKYRKSNAEGTKLGAETQKAQLEAGAMAAKQFADTMAGVRDQQSYQAAMSSLASNPAFAPMLQQLPQQWTPEFGQQAVRQAMIAHGKISELLPKFQQVDAGNRVITGAVDPQTAQFTQQGAPIVKAPQGFNVGADGSLSADPGFVQAKSQIAAAGAPRIDIHNTKGQEAADKKFATDFVDFATGGYADVVKQLDQLREASATLKSGTAISGPIMGSVPDAVLAATNPQAVATKEMIQEVAQRNLRLVLGAQFTEKEGERLIARVFNPRLGEAENAKRVDRLIKQISDAAKAKLDAAKYFEQNGSLTGWPGRLPRITDFDPDPAAPTQSEPAATGAKRLRFNPATGQLE